MAASAAGPVWPAGGLLVAICVMELSIWPVRGLMYWPGRRGRSIARSGEPAEGNVSSVPAPVPSTRRHVLPHVDAAVLLSAPSSHCSPESTIRSPQNAKRQSVRQRSGSESLLRSPSSHSSPGFMMPLPQKGGRILGNPDTSPMLPTAPPGMPSGVPLVNAPMTPPCAPPSSPPRVPSMVPLVSPPVVPSDAPESEELLDREDTHSIHAGDLSKFGMHMRLRMPQ